MGAVAIFCYAKNFHKINVGVISSHG